MSMKLNTRLANIAHAVRNRFRKGIRTRDAIGISIMLHLLIALSLASFLVGTLYVPPHDQDSVIEFDLVTQEISTHAADQIAGQNAQKTAGVAKATSQTSGFSQEASDKKAVLMASLGSLSDLKASFKFVMNQVSSDSMGIAPMQGSVPSTAFFGGAFGEGNDGHGGFSFGVCAPSPRY